MNEPSRSIWKWGPVLVVRARFKDHTQVALGVQAGEWSVAWTFTRWQSSLVLQHVAACVTVTAGWPPEWPTRTRLARGWRIAGALFSLRWESGP